MLIELVGATEILIRFVLKRLDAEVGKPEICARRTGQLTDGRREPSLVQRRLLFLLYYLFQFNLSEDSASLKKKKVKLRRKALFI